MYVKASTSLKWENPTVPPHMYQYHDDQWRRKEFSFGGHGSAILGKSPLGFWGETPVCGLGDEVPKLKQFADNFPHILTA